MPEITAEELARILQRLDDVCRQAQDLQREIRGKMIADARSIATDRGRTPDRSGQPSETE